MIGVSATPPFSSQSTVFTPQTITSLPLTFPASAVGKSIRTIDYLLPQAHVLQYNLTVERQLPWNMALTTAYAGSRGINLVRTVEGNPTVPGGIPSGGLCVARPAGQAFNINAPYCWLGGDPRTNPNWQTMEFKTGGGNSWYNSLQVGLTKRMSKGLQFQGSYTWAKVLDVTQGQFGADDNSSSVFGSDPNHPLTDKGPATFDVRQNLRFNTIYRMPNLAMNGILGKVLSGWWMSGILSLQSGYLFTVALQSNRSRSGVNGGGAGIDRPNVVLERNNGNIVSGTTAGCAGVAPGQKLGTPDIYFDPCAFTIPAAGFLGTESRNFLFGPGLANLDFSLVKDTAIKHLGESGRLEFRAEFFNILNHANFAIPNRTAFAGNANPLTVPGPYVEAALSSAGVITATSNKSRQVQFALKLVF